MHPRCSHHELPDGARRLPSLSAYRVPQVAGQRFVDPGSQFKKKHSSRILRKRLLRVCPQAEPCPHVGPEISQGKLCSALQYRQQQARQHRLAVRGVDKAPESPVFGKNRSAITVTRMNAPMPDANRSSADTEKTFSSRLRGLTANQSLSCRDCVSNLTSPKPIRAPRWTVHG